VSNTKKNIKQNKEPTKMSNKEVRRTVREGVEKAEKVSQRENLLSEVREYICVNNDGDVEIWKRVSFCGWVVELNDWGSHCEIHGMYPNFWGRKIIDRL